MTEETTPTPFDLPENDGQDIYRLELPAGANFMLYKDNSEIEWHQILRDGIIYCNSSGLVFAYAENPQKPKATPDDTNAKP